jgi:cytochrome c553
MLERSLPYAAAIIAAAAVSALTTMSARAEDQPQDAVIAAKAQACAVCHGMNGTPISATFPIIWGQQGSYLYKELHDFHSGDRNNPVMAPLIQGTSLEDLRAIANYLAAKPWPAKQADTGAAAAPPEAIAAKMQQCKSCHQANFEGGAPAPRLAGLSYEYLRSSMNAFANGQRTNNLDMPGFMKSLTASERDAMAKYLAGL